MKSIKKKPATKRRKFDETGAFLNQ